jgi:4-amino-4-deoxy-L-arabinose transferase-like glycosyltransferase
LLIVHQILDPNTVTVNRAQLPLFLLLAAAVSVFFVDLGGSSIWDANEAFYVETPREMIERGDYVFPTFNGEPRVNKPVLSYWIVAGFYKLFGVSVGVQRIPIAIGGLLLVGITFFLGRLVSVETADPAVSVRAGLWAALGLAVSPRLVMFSRRIFIDIYITLFMAATLLLFALAERYPHRRRLFLALMYVSVGLGVLTKGPVAVALPGLVFLIYLIVHRELRRVTQLMIPAGVAIVLAIVVPWYAALYQRDGWTHIASFFLGENLGRYSDGVGFDTGRGPWFYVGVLFSDGFPWSILFVAALALWWRLRRVAAPKGRATPSPEPRAQSPEPRVPSPSPRAPALTKAPLRIQTLLLLWIATIVVFFSFSASKQDLYIYPVMPAIAALGGGAIAAGAPGARWLSALIGALLAIAGAAVLYVFQRSGNIYEIDGIALISAVALAGGLAALALAATGRWHKGLLAMLAAVVLVNWILVLRVLPSFEKYKPVPRLTAFLESRITPGDVIAHYSIALPSMVYYLRRHIEVTYDRGTFIGIMRQPERVYGILWIEEYARLKNDVGVPTCAVFRTRSFNVKIGAVIEREPLPELVVIANRCE